ncbi:uncharacterized protein FTOL_02145 [Fusarium torulosum]|uniref:Uncharacterized protein n=1 Tax=Fusarium torulosum TaxID=33205 RepID=A0AAE8M1G8_9HYPO|nr:uncharacterized protein FTOL_02145 [Fusarium torulosum]
MYLRDPGSRTIPVHELLCTLQPPEVLHLIAFFGGWNCRAHTPLPPVLSLYARRISRGKTDLSGVMPRLAYISVRRSTARDGALPAPNKQERGFQGVDPRRANFLCDVWDELN